MKTHFILKTILLSIMLSFSVSAWADGNDSIPPIAKDPYGNKIEIPLKGIIWDRSLFEPINAYYYIGEYTIEMEFNENVGTVNVSITNSNGVTIYNLSHDTSIESGCTIFLPPKHDYYTIYIAGRRYEAYAHVSI